MEVETISSFRTTVFPDVAQRSNRHYLEDRGQHGGVSVNGKKTDKKALKDGDIISFGFEGAYQITFRSSVADASVQRLLTLIGSMPAGDSSSSGLGKLNLLLETTMLLHSQLPVDAVLSTMLDHAIAVTGADRGLLLERDPPGPHRVRLAPSQTALSLAMERQSSAGFDILYAHPFRGFQDEKKRARFQIDLR